MTTPTNIREIDPDTAETMRAAGWQAVVYAAYAYSDLDAGDIVSKHRSYDAAQRKIAGSSFWAIKDL